VVTGCWATSHAGQAEKLPGVDAVLTHNDDIAGRLDRLLGLPSLPFGENRVGTRSLPLIGERQPGHQRAFLKVQDGCDARCTYCIIPQLRSVVWSKPVEDAVDEARRLVAAGHREIVLTGIFLGAYGHATALRRRQACSDECPIGQLVEALCTRVAGLHRLRLSSLEPGDLTPRLIAVLRSHRQVVPHFHLPLQSGSDRVLRRMNRQYTRSDFLEMIDQVNAAFDRAALTTDVLTGFPGETDDDFEQTLDVVDRAKFIHIHAFPFSPRPGTAAARWTDHFVPCRVARARTQQLVSRAAACGFAFRSQFLGEQVEILVERTNDPTFQHGRCERYFDVHFEHPEPLTGRGVRLRVDRVTPTRTFGSVTHVEPEQADR
jgi:threonylcarbamoyladenosine tRNA methylthiotransferase MtaB